MAGRRGNPGGNPGISAGNGGGGLTMSTPFYVSPEQLMKDKADYARKGIARGRAVVVLAHADGIVFVSENASRALHKISEIYDRVAFAAVGKYNEFENLRVAGVRYADVRGYSYDRSDVTARGLANAYAQTLGAIFTDRVEALRGRDRRRRGRTHPRDRPDLPPHLRRLRRRRARLRRHGRFRRADRRQARRTLARRARPWPRPSQLAVEALGSDAAAEAAGAGPRRSPPTTSRSPSWTAPATAPAPSAASPAASWPGRWPPRDAAAD